MKSGTFAGGAEVLQILIIFDEGFALNEYGKE
jgi:hypothetical protein